MIARVIELTDAGHVILFFGRRATLFGVASELIWKRHHNSRTSFKETEHNLSDEECEAIVRLLLLRQGHTKLLP